LRSTLLNKRRRIENGDRIGHVVSLRSNFETSKFDLDKEAFEEGTVMKAVMNMKSKLLQDRDRETS